MKVSPHVAILDRFDKQMVADLTERDPQTGAPIGEVRREDITSGYLMLDAVWGPDPEKKNLSGKENMERFEIAQKIKRAIKELGLVDLDQKERTLILAITEKKWAPGVYGQLELVMRDQPDPPAPAT